MLLGLRMSFRLKNRVDILEETVNFLASFKIELEYTGNTLYSLLCKARSSSLCRNLDYLKMCCELMKKGDDFPKAWSSSFQSSNLPYKSEEKQKLLHLGNVLGTTDLSSQSTILALYTEYFKSYYNQACEINKKYGRLSALMGVFLGFGVFIMIV